MYRICMKCPIVIVFLVYYVALELQVGDCMVDYYGEVLSRQRKMEESNSAETEFYDSIGTKS